VVIFTPLVNRLWRTPPECNWSSEKYFPVFHDSLRYRMLKAVVDGNWEAVDKVLEEGWDINAGLDLH
jgi:hypothetical protein